MILVAVPYHKEKRYALNYLHDWLDKAELPNTEVIMRWHQGKYGETNAVKAQREFFRKLALDMNASHLMFIGADTIPPLDVLPRLLAHGADVIGGVYYSRHKLPAKPPFPLVWLDNQPEPNDLWLTGDKPLEADGMGMDCVLFSQKALNDFSYFEYEQSDDDWPVYRLLKQKGYKILIDPTIVCRHYVAIDKYYGEWTKE